MERIDCISAFEPFGRSTAHDYYGAQVYGYRFSFLQKTQKNNCHGRRPAWAAAVSIFAKGVRAMPKYQLLRPDLVCMTILHQASARPFRGKQAVRQVLLIEPQLQAEIDAETTSRGSQSSGGMKREPKLEPNSVKTEVGAAPSRIYSWDAAHYRQRDDAFIRDLLPGRGRGRPSPCSYRLIPPDPALGGAAGKNELQSRQAVRVPRISPQTRRECPRQDQIAKS